MSYFRINFRITENPNIGSPGPDWKRLVKDNKNLVDEKGQPVNVNYKGNKYQVVEEWEKTLSIFQRILNVFLGISAITCSLGFGILSKRIRRLFTDSKECIRYGMLASPTPLPLEAKAGVTTQIAQKTIGLNGSSPLPTMGLMEPTTTPVEPATPTGIAASTPTVQQTPVSTATTAPTPIVLQTPVPAETAIPTPIVLQTPVQKETATAPLVPQTPVPIEPIPTPAISKKQEANEILMIPPEQPAGNQSSTNISTVPPVVAPEQPSPPPETEYEISEKSLQSGIDIPDQVMLTLKGLIGSIYKGETNAQVKMYTSNIQHRVFELTELPNIIFKMKSCNGPKTGLFKKKNVDSIRSRYETIIRAETVVRVSKLSLLVVPRAKFFDIKDEDGNIHTIIAEQKVDIEDDESKQERLYANDSKTLDEAIKQLATFICETGYSDVTWRNNPVLNSPPDSEGNRKLVLIDTEEMGKPQLGLFGNVGRGPYRRGLIGCITSEQGAFVQEIAIKHGIDTGFFKTVMRRRGLEILERCQLRKSTSQPLVDSPQIDPPLPPPLPPPEPAPASPTKFKVGMVTSQSCISNKRAGVGSMKKRAMTW